MDEKAICFTSMKSKYNNNNAASYVWGCTHPVYTTGITMYGDTLMY